LETLLNSQPPDMSAQALVDCILAAVRDHLGGEEAQDDMTILAIRSRDVPSEKTPAVSQGEE
jgi:hypothetical protein